MTKTVFALLLLGGALLAASMPASAASTYTFFVSGSAVGQTSPGVAKDYTLNITNLNASAAISFNLSIVSGPLGWTTQLSQASFTVPATQTRQVTLSVVPPSGALADAVGQYVNVTATPDDNTTAQTVSTTTRVTEVFGVSVTLIPTAGTSGDPGANITWLAYVKNTGNSQQTYTINLNNTSFTSTNLTTNLVTVAPGDTRVILVTINISTTAPVGTLFSRISATSNANASSTDSILFAATVNAKRAVGLSGLTPDDLKVSTESEASVVVRNIIVENKGNVADSYTLSGTANASRHGDWVTFETTSLSLGAFTQRYLNVTVAVPAGTAKGDYTVEFRILSDNSTQVIAFINLTITVIDKHDLSIVYESLVALQSGLPGSTVSFPVNVSNPGAYSQRVDLYYIGGNSSWVTISANPFTLASGAYKIVYYNFTIPGTAPPAAFNFQVKGTIDWTNPYRNRTVDLTLQVSQVYDTVISSAVSASSGAPGATVAFTVSIRNNGTGTDSFSVVSANATQAGLVTVAPASITLAAGASGNVTVSVAIALSPQPLAGVYYYTVTATSSGNVSRTASLPLALTVTQTYALVATMTPASKTADPGAVATFTISVVNNGNGPDTITLERTGANQTWVSFPVGSGTIAAGARMNFTVEAQAPTFALTGTTLLSAKAVSGGDANVSSTATFSLSLNALLQFAITTTPGSVPNAHRSTTQTVDVTIRNSGNVADTYLVTLEGTDAAWTLLPFNTVALLPNENASFTLSIDVPALPANGAHVFYINGTSLANATVFDNATFTVTVNDVFEPFVSVALPERFAQPYTNVSITATVRNDGTIADTLTLTVTTPTTLNQTIVRSFALGPGGGGTTQITIEMNYPLSGTYQVVLTLASTNDTAKWDTAFVNITMLVDRRVDLVATSGAPAEGGPGVTRTFTMRVDNLGNITDSYFLDYSLPGANWLISFSDNNFALLPLTSMNVTVSVTPPAGVAAGTYSMTISAASKTIGSALTVRDLSSVVYSVSYVHALTNASASPTLLPGESATVTVLLSNDGSADNDYTLLPNGTAAPWAVVSPNFVSLAAHTSTLISVDIAVPAGQHEGARTLILEARATSGGALRTLPITVTVSRVFGFALVAPSAPLTVSPGQAAVFNFSVQNMGNANDTYTFLASPGTYAAFSVPQAIADAGQTAAFAMLYTPPANGATGSLTVEVSVYGGGSHVERANVTVVVRQVYNLTARGTPNDAFAASGGPGSEVSMSFNITNRGNGADTFTWSLSGPAAAWATTSSGQVLLAPGFTTAIPVTFDIPTDPLVAVAGAVPVNVSVSSVGSAGSVSATVLGAVTVDVFSSFTASFDANAPLASMSVNYDRPDRTQHDYTIYLTNRGNRPETLQLSRAQISGWSIILLVSGSPGSTVIVPAGGTAMATVRIASFPASDPGQTVSVTVRAQDGAAPPVALSIQVGFLDSNVAFTSDPLDVSELNPTVGSTVSVTVSVRNAGPGTATNVVVRLIVDGQIAASSQSIPTLVANRTVPLTLTWNVGDSAAGASHTLSVEIQGSGESVQAPDSVTVPGVTKGLIAKLTTDRDVMMLVGIFLVVGLVVGLAARGRRRAPAPPPPLPAPAPGGSPESAMDGLASLEAEGMGGEAAAAGAGTVVGAAAGAAPVEHKIVCPNCGTEQWIRGAEGECKQCGVIIEVSEEADDGAPPTEDA